MGERGRLPTGDSKGHRNEDFNLVWKQRCCVHILLLSWEWGTLHPAFQRPHPSAVRVPASFPISQTAQGAGRGLMGTTGAAPAPPGILEEKVRFMQGMECVSPAQPGLKPVSLRLLSYHSFSHSALASSRGRLWGFSGRWLRAIMAVLCLGCPVADPGPGLSGRKKLESGGCQASQHSPNGTKGVSCVLFPRCTEEGGGHVPAIRLGSEGGAHGCLLLPTFLAGWRVLWEAQSQPAWAAGGC